MNHSISQLAKLVFNNTSIEECSLQQLQKLADQYPYFAPSQLLLAEKLKETSGQSFNQQLQKTSLYINNPLWLDLLMNPDEYKQEDFNIRTFPDKVADDTTEPVKINPAAENETTEAEAIFPPLKINIKSDNEQPLTFEPYYSVDYFASQGIKFDQEVKKDDRFGQQLKSFIEWLKEMKKLPETEKTNSIDSGLEQKVVKLAEHSILDDEIITESMAEVWAKQGNSLKAIEVYRKLSLLNPAKSTYFAAKIEQLKKEH